MYFDFIPSMIIFRRYEGEGPPLLFLVLFKFADWAVAEVSDQCTDLVDPCMYLKRRVRVL
jgi:hypothetical protein